MAVSGIFTLGSEGTMAQALIQAQFTLIGCTKREGDWFIAYCPPLDITTQGRDEAEAKGNLKEAASLFIISCIERGTLDQALRELGFVRVGNHAAPRRPHNSFEMVIPVPMRF